MSLIYTRRSNRWEEFNENGMKYVAKPFKIQLFYSFVNINITIIDDDDDEYEYWKNHTYTRA